MHGFQHNWKTALHGLPAWLKDIIARFASMIWRHHCKICLHDWKISLQELPAWLKDIIARIAYIIWEYHCKVCLYVLKTCIFARLAFLIWRPHCMVRENELWTPLQRLSVWFKDISAWCACLMWNRHYVIYLHDLKTAMHGLIQKLHKTLHLQVVNNYTTVRLDYFRKHGIVRVHDTI